MARKHIVTRGAGQVASWAGLMVRVQSVMIFLLVVLVAEEYNYNVSFQGWVSGSLGMFGFLFGGTIASVYGGLLIVFYLSPPRPPRVRGRVERRELVVVTMKTLQQNARNHDFMEGGAREK